MRTELYWIEGDWPGRLAVMPRPRGGDWLEDEIRSLQREKVALLVSLLTDEEIAEFELGDEEKLIRLSGIEFRFLPIVDRSVPDSNADARALVLKVADQLRMGGVVAIHCRQGIGRAGMIAAAALIILGDDAEIAMRRVSAARGRPVPETDEQRRWITEFARSLKSPKLPVDPSGPTGDNPTHKPALPPASVS